MNAKMLREYVSGKSEYVSPRYMGDPELTVMNALERGLSLDELERLSSDTYDKGFSKFDRLMHGGLVELEKSLEPYTKNSRTLAKDLKDAMQKAKSAREKLDRWASREAEKQNESFLVKGYPNPL